MTKQKTDAATKPEVTAKPDCQACAYYDVAPWYEPCIKCVNTRGSEDRFVRRPIDENEALRRRVAALKGALGEIADAHIPSQPAAFNMSDLDWAVRHVRELCRIARDALEETGEDQ